MLTDWPSEKRKSLSQEGGIPFVPRSQILFWRRSERQLHKRTETAADHKGRTAPYTGVDASCDQSACHRNRRACRGCELCYGVQLEIRGARFHARLGDLTWSQTISRYRDLCGPLPRDNAWLPRCFQLSRGILLLA